MRPAGTRSAPEWRLSRRRIDFKLIDECRDIGDGLSIGQMMSIREMLHTDVPATVVAVVHQLFCQYGSMLSCDSRYSTIDRTGARRPVTCGAGSKKLRTSIQTWRAVQGVEQFLPRGR